MGLHGALIRGDGP